MWTDGHTKQVSGVDRWSYYVRYQVWTDGHTMSGIRCGRLLGGYIDTFIANACLPQLVQLIQMSVAFVMQVVETVLNDAISLASASSGVA